MYNNDSKFSLYDLEYYRERNRNRAYTAVVSLFSRLVETKNLTKREIAYRLGKEPAQITRWFSGPSNWTLDTVSDLLLAMGAEVDDYKAVLIGQKTITVKSHPLHQHEPNIIYVNFDNKDSKPQTGTTNNQICAEVATG